MRIAKAVLATFLFCASSAISVSAVTAPKNIVCDTNYSSLTSKFGGLHHNSQYSARFSILLLGKLTPALIIASPDTAADGSRERETGSKVAFDTFLEPYAFLLLGLVLLIGGTLLRKRLRQSHH